MDREENSARYGYSFNGGGGSGGGGSGGSGGGGCNGGGSGGCRSEKGKQKKVYKRGLSVAQLEKLRQEEQQNKGAVPNFDLNVSSSPIRDNKQKSVSQEGEKMIGVKRSYPFSLETPQAPSFLGKFDPSYAMNISKSDKSAAINNGYTTHMEPRKDYISKVPSNSSPLPEQHSGELIRDNRRINGDFLTLATPAPAPPPSRLLGQILCDFGYLSSQGSAKNIIHGTGSSMGQTSTSFSSAKFQDDQTAPHVHYGNVADEEAVDLDLKL